MFLLVPWALAVTALAAPWIITQLARFRPPSRPPSAPAAATTTVPAAE